MKRSRMPKWLLNVCGVLALVVAVIGVVVPLLPTTPLVLLAAGCFLRGSERMHRWITTHPWFGKMIRDYQEAHVVSKRTKIVALVVLWLSIGYSAGIAIDLWWVRVLVLMIGAGVTVHIAKLRTEREPDRHDID